MGNVYTVNEILVGALSDRPAPDRNIILYVDSATGKASLADGTTWNDFGSLPGVTSDGLMPGGVLASRYSSVPLIPDPTGAGVVPIVTAVSAASQGMTALPAGSYDYVFAWEDSHGNSTLISNIASVTVSGSQVVQLEAPTPYAAPYVSYYRYVNGSPLQDIQGNSASSPAYDNAPDGDLDPTALAPEFNHTYPASHFGPTEIAGTTRAFQGVSEFSHAPLIVQPIVTASRADAQAQIDALYAILATKGTLIDSRTA